MKYKGFTEAHIFVATQAFHRQGENDFNEGVLV
jgi:hypothetical protein